MIFHVFTQIYTFSFGSFIKHILLASRVHHEVGFKASERKAILQQPSFVFARTNIFSESKMCYFLLYSE